VTKYSKGEENGIVLERGDGQAKKKKKKKMMMMMMMMMRRDETKARRI
jgi:hypothetical protein